MRFQDWDVLLFPEGSSVPVQEFRTTSFLVQENVIQTPTLMTYIPSLPEGDAFIVSLHSWTPPRFSSTVALHSHDRGKEPAWGLRVIVDGVCVSSSTFTERVSWPQIMNNSDQVNAKGALKPLSFPAFHRSILSRRDWNVTDDPGRVRILLTEGLRIMHEGRNMYQPVNNIVCFAFQPAPMSYLQRCNIAWPTTAMCANPCKPKESSKSIGVLPLKAARYPGWSAAQTACSEMANTRRDIEADEMPAPVLPRPHAFPGLFDQRVPLKEDLSSRSTSAATHFSMWNDEPKSADIGTMDSTSPSHKLHSRPKSSQIRLPSDQIREIISALCDHRFGTQGPQHQTAPWPLSDSVHAQDCSASVEDYPAYQARTNRDRNVSDVTMHAGCTGFPECTVDDPVSGELIHRTPHKRAAPTSRHDSPLSHKAHVSLSSQPVVGASQSFAAPVSQPAPGRKRGRSPLSAIGHARRTADGRDDRSRKISKTVIIADDDDEDKENTLLTVL